MTQERWPFVDKRTPLLDWADAQRVSEFDALGPAIFAALWGTTGTADGSMFYNLSARENDSQWLQEFLLAIQRLCKRLEERGEFNHEISELQQLYEWVQERVEITLDMELEEQLREELDE